MVLTTTLLKNGAADFHQSVKPSVKVWDVPSAKFTVTVPLAAPKADAPRIPRVVALLTGVTETICPFARQLSGGPGCTFGHWKEKPLVLTGLPGVIPAPANA